jgi:hypothetical protein
MPAHQQQLLVAQGSASSATTIVRSAMLPHAYVNLTATPRQANVAGTMVNS